MGLLRTSESSKRSSHSELKRRGPNQQTPQHRGRLRAGAQGSQRFQFYRVSALSPLGRMK